jgi:hypothetical protein
MRFRYKQFAYGEQPNGLIGLESPLPCCWHRAVMVSRAGVGVGPLTCFLHVIDNTNRQNLPNLLNRSNRRHFGDTGLATPPTGKVA